MSSISCSIEEEDICDISINSKNMAKDDERNRLKDVMMDL